MKHLIPIPLIFMSVIFGFITSSCHKAKQTSTITTVSPICGLTAMGHRSPFDTGTVAMSPYIVWNFSGTNPISGIANTDTFFFKNEQLSFTGINATQIFYQGSQSQPTLNVTVTYTPANQIDTITFQYALPISMPEKMVFQYSGSQITKVIVAYTSNTSDTFHWSTPDVYNYTYAGSNISRIAIYRNGTTDSEIHTYYAGSRSNNFAGCLPVFLLLEFIPIQSTSPDEFLLDMPLYTNANFVDSTRVGTIGGSFETFTIGSFTDAAGRITQRIYSSSTSSPDTVFYFY